MKKLLERIPLDRVKWVTSAFLMGTLAVAIVGVPWFVWQHGLDGFQIGLFIGLYIATGLSITVGYHRLFSHLAFKATWPVRLFTLIFGAASFENSALDWCSDHRRHHKHVDQEADPYDITLGFWWAHIGWLMFKLRPKPPMDNVNDLRKDPLVMWQHRNFVLLGVTFGFGLPTLLGYFYGGATGALGAFLIGGVARIVAVQHSTFCINSLCHMIGSRPYSSKCSARDSWIAALVTFGEGYHNFHHEFQHDFRNGVKPWQFDPTKWAIFLLSKMGLVSNLRRVPEVKILLAELREAEYRLEKQSAVWGSDSQIHESKLSATKRVIAAKYRQQLCDFSASLNDAMEELQRAVKERMEVSKEVIEHCRREIKSAMKALAWLKAEIENSSQQSAAAC